MAAHDDETVKHAVHNDPRPLATGWWCLAERRYSHPAPDDGESTPPVFDRSQRAHDSYPVPESDTALHFSSRETAAAKALREQLAARGAAGHAWTVKWPSLSAGRQFIFGGVAGLPRRAVLRSERRTDDTRTTDQ